MTDIPYDELTPLEELAKLLKDQRRRWRKWFLGIALLIVALAAGQVRTQHAADKAQVAVDDVVAQRTEARVNACFKDKKFADAHNNLVLYFTNIPPNPAEVRTAAQRDARAALIKDFEAKNLVPVPDCSPAGIAAFYAGQGGTLSPVIQTPTTAATSPTTAVTKRTTSTTRATTTSSRPRATTSTSRPPSATRPRPTTTTACAGPSIPVQGVPCL